MIQYVVLALVSCFISYAVAVGFMYWGSKPQAIGPSGVMPDLGDPVKPARRDIRSWRRHASRDWPESPRIANEHRYFGVRYLSMLRYEDVPDPVNGPVEEHKYSVWVGDFGWPFLSAGAESWADYQPAQQVQWQHSVIRVGEFHFPDRVIWSGHITNILIYTLLIISVARGASGARRLIRRKRGRCPHCSYELQHRMETGCPECGWNRGR